MQRHCCYFFSTLRFFFRTKFSGKITPELLPVHSLLSTGRRPRLGGRAAPDAEPCEGLLHGNLDRSAGLGSNWFVNTHRNYKRDCIVGLAFLFCIFIEVVPCPLSTSTEPGSKDVLCLRARDVVSTEAALAPTPTPPPSASDTGITV